MSTPCVLSTLRCCLDNADTLHTAWILHTRHTTGRVQRAWQSTEGDELLLHCVGQSTEGDV